MLLADPALVTANVKIMITISRGICGDQSIVAGQIYRAGAQRQAETRVRRPGAGIAVIADPAHPPAIDMAGVDRKPIQQTIPSARPARFIVQEFAAVGFAQPDLVGPGAVAAIPLHIDGIGRAGKS